MGCKSCGSSGQREFPAEINIHPPTRGLKNMDKPTVWAFPSIMVCSNCGFAEFVLGVDELKSLEENYRDEMWPNGRAFGT